MRSEGDEESHLCKLFWQPKNCMAAPGKMRTKFVDVADATRGASAWKTAFDATTRRSGQLKTVGYFFPASQKVRYAP